MFDRNVHDLPNTGQLKRKSSTFIGGLWPLADLSKRRSDCQLLTLCGYSAVSARCERRSFRQAKKP